MLIPTLPALPEAWGALFFLANKIFFSAKEHARDPLQKTKWSAWSWSLYLVGLGPVVWMLAVKNDWMATWVEVGGGPAMVVGLIRAIRKLKGLEDLFWLKKFETWMYKLAYACTALGVIASLWYYHGLEHLTQLYELGLSIGFLIGTLALVDDRRSGYLWYVLMHVSTSALCFTQHYQFFAVQQIISLGFVIDAYLVRGRREKEVAQSPSRS